MGPDVLRIENSEDTPLDMTYLSGRFHRAGNIPEESTGLGFSIVQAICEAFRLHLSYTYTSRHLFELKNKLIPHLPVFPNLS
ncbi:MAG: ATP-binding protein [Bacteroides sp.]|nr:ATP-binding protein [Bacteroides sp.]